MVGGGGIPAERQVALDLCSILGMVLGERIKISVIYAPDLIHSYMCGIVRTRSKEASIFPSMICLDHRPLNPFGSDDPASYDGSREGGKNRSQGSS
jgi:hypothetical protein